MYFYGPTPNQFFVNRTPEKTELLDDISFYKKETGTNLCVMTRQHFVTAPGLKVDESTAID